jgi:hypothetical protein
MTLSPVNTDNAAAAVPPVPRPVEPAHIIRTDAEAIAIAKTLAAEFIQESALRDRDRIWPVKELDAFSQSGPLVDQRAAGVSAARRSRMRTLAQVIAILCGGRFHRSGRSRRTIWASWRPSGPCRTQAQTARCSSAEVLRGTRFGNAFSERGSKRAADFETRVRRCRRPRGGATARNSIRIGRAARASRADRGARWRRAVPGTRSRERDAPGLTVIDDWSSFGQRGTAIVGNRAARGRAGAQDASGPRLEGLRGAHGGRRGVPDHPGGRRCRDRPRGPAIDETDSLRARPRAAPGWIPGWNGPGTIPIRSRRSAI